MVQGIHRYLPKTRTSEEEPSTDSYQHVPREEPTMTWLDDQGIAHDGEPPQGHQMLGGRWYPMDADSYSSVRHDRELLAVC